MARSQLGQGADCDHNPSQMGGTRELLKVSKNLGFQNLSSSFPSPVTCSKMHRLVPQADENDLIEKAFTVETLEERGARLKRGWIRQAECAEHTSG